MTKQDMVIAQLRRALFKSGDLSVDARGADAPIATIRTLPTNKVVYTCPLCGNVHHVRHDPATGTWPAGCEYAGRPAYKPLVHLVNEA